MEFRIGLATGEVMWIQVATQPVVIDGALAGYIGTAIDCTTLVTQRQLSDQLVGLLDVSGDAVLVFDRVGELMFANDTARTLIGVTDPGAGAGDVAARTFMQAVRDQLPRVLLDAAPPADSSHRWEGEIGFRSPDGIARTLSVVVQVVRDANGSVHHWATITRDITEERQSQAELARQATHDALTGLPNRVLFERKTTEALERSKTTHSSVAVLFIDLDKLKHVNDTIGHAVGDQLIVTVARRLAAATRPSDLVARISGDEFVVLCEGLLDEQVALDVAERIRTSITGPLVLQGVEIEAGASIGVAMSTPELLNTESAADAAVTLLRSADTAMYRAKQRGRGRSELYSEDMRTAAKARQTLASELEQALAGDQFAVVFQPIESAHTGRVVAAEALLRWNHPTRGLLAPGAFLDLADESGLIAPIGDWVLNESARTVAEWISTGLVDRVMAIHVNASRRQLSDITFVDRALTILRDNNLEGSQLVFETSEATLVDNNPSVLRTVTALKRQGVRIAVDDFGAGYSSLASLRTFPADLLKLDGTLVRDVGRTDGGDDPMVRSLIQLAHSLNLIVCAEWVTTEDHVQRLKVLGCDLLQGNRIGEPISAEAFTTKLRRTTALIIQATD
ncbi:MAG: EAL domain-containing protein [Ilumatobacteraceae bacterium]|nr:EAL domain-containing protein [Ilumatobacteraceae bacterium]MDP5068718.1 EAL domain-containing protein [Ilumatobacteraceae bacterium]